MENKKNEIMLSLYDDSDRIIESFQNSSLIDTLTSLPERYKVDKLIGEGSFKCVYLAHDLIMDRKVAIAKLKSTSEEISISLINEARLMSRLEHPFISPIYDLGFDENNSPYFVMKLFEGFSLDTSIQKKLSSCQSIVDFLPWSLEIFTKVCDAISYAHSHEVLHLDIKPQNIKANIHSEVLISDWGISRNFLQEYNEKFATNHTENFEKYISSATVFGKIQGTPGFMAPEQINYKETLDQRTDVYGLGALFHYLLTGNRLMDNLFDEDIKVPLELYNICLKAISQKKEDRYQSVDAILEDIQKYKKTHYID